MVAPGLSFMCSFRGLGEARNALVTGGDISAARSGLANGELENRRKRRAIDEVRFGHNARRLAAHDVLDTEGHEEALGGATENVPAAASADSNSELRKYVTDPSL